MDKRFDAGILQSDRIDHSAFAFGYTGCRVSETGFLRRSFEGDASEDVQVETA